MRLVKRIVGSTRTPKGDPHLGHENGSGVAYSPDGEVYETLAGEPPIAQTQGWGDMSWFCWGRRP